MATSGALIMGVEAMPPSLPRLVTVMVEPVNSSRRRLVGARALGKPANFRRDFPQAKRLRVAHHRNLQSIGCLGRNADMHGTVPDQHAARRVVKHIALRKGVEHTRERHHHQRQIAQGTCVFGARQVQMRAQRLEFGDIDFFDIGKVRNVALGLAHALGNQTAQSDDFDFRRVGRIGRHGRALARASSSQLRRMRPPGPEPATVVRSMPASLARRRFAGEAMTRPGVRRGRRGAAAGLAADTAAGATADFAAGAGAARGRRRRGARRRCGSRSPILRPRSTRTRSAASRRPPCRRARR